MTSTTMRLARRPFVACALFAAAAAGARTLGAQAPVPIQDNSFLIEEAYNQERGVVQHISAFMRDGRSGSWMYAFTQEWPFLSQAHQLSVTLPLQHAAGTSNGMGDAALSYRFQASGIGGGNVLFAPRLTALLPTGDAARGFGAGGAGVQVNLPLSLVHGSRIVTHWNAGATWTPAARDPMGGHVALAAWNAGQSVVWLAHPKLNFLVETSWTRVQSAMGAGATAWNDALLVSPGVRAAVDAAHGVQVVPGIGVPIGVGPSRGTRFVFGYLSFEHAF
jgi:hypothetical protein